jgi:microcystin-dependent protein
MIFKKDIMKNNITARRGFFKTLGGLVAGTALTASATKAEEKEGKSIKSGMYPYVGDVIMVGFNFAPEGWFLCNGQELNISDYQALYAVIGITYGGDGVTKFKVPDLRGCAPLGMGQGAGLTNRTIGQRGGAEIASVSTSQLPVHSHPVPINSANGSTDSPVGSYISKNNEGVKQFAGTQNGGAAATGVAGSGYIYHQNMQPFQAINFIIAAEGEFPQQTKK